MQMSSSRCQKSWESCAIATRGRCSQIYLWSLQRGEPSSEALEAIRKFAKLTGDLPALSAVDLRVLALAWMCEKEAKGGVGHLRTTPPPPGEQSTGAAVAARKR